MRVEPLDGENPATTMSVSLTLGRLRGVEPPSQLIAVLPRIFVVGGHRRYRIAIRSGDS
jgi:hypothetical protein